MAGYKGFTYDELVKPLESVQKAHNEVITDMASLSQNSEILDYYLDPNRDKESYNLYNKFKNELNFNVDDFARNGLTRNNGMKLLSLHRNYNNNVANVLDAVKNREADRAQQQKIQEQSKGQAIFGLNGTDGDANGRSVDFYLQGNKGFAHQNLDDVRKEAKRFATAASKREYTNNFDKNVNENNTEANLKALAGQYWQMMERTGYDNRQAYRIINYLMDEYEHIIDGKDVPDYEGSHPDGFIKNMRRMLQERNIDQFSDEDKGRMISAYINGIDEGLTYDPKYTWKETEKMKIASRNSTVVNFPGQTANTNETDFNENTMTVKHVHNRETKEKRDKIINELGEENNPFIITYDATTSGRTGGMQLASLKQMLDNLPKDSDGDPYIEVFESDPDSGMIYTRKIKLKYGSKEAQKYYDDYINDLKTKFLLSTEEINELKNGKDIKTTLTEANKRIENMPTATSIPTYELIIPGDQTPSILETTRVRARSGESTGAHYGLTFNDTTQEYEFEGDVDNSTIDKFYDKDFSSAKQKGCLMQLVYAPIGDDLFQVAFCSTAWEEPMFFPLSAFSSASGDYQAKRINDMYQIQRKMLDELKNKLGETTDKNAIEKIKSSIKVGEIEKDYLNKKLLIMASRKGSMKSTKDILDDIVVDPETGRVIKI